MRHETAPLHPLPHHRPLKHFLKDPSEAILGDPFPSCACSLWLWLRPGSPPWVSALADGGSHVCGLWSLVSGVGGHLEFLLKLTLSASLLILPSEWAASLMTSFSCFSGHLLPTGASSPQGKGPAGSWGKFCLCWEQVEAGPAGALG